MTLSNFKSNLKLTLILTLLITYGTSFFVIGKISPKFNDFFKREEVSTNRLDNSLEKPLPNSDIQSGEVISSYVKLCSNTVYGFEVAYPQDWFTTYGSDDQKCLFFAPFSFVIHANPESNFVPIKIEVIKTEEWLQTVKFYENPNDFENVISVQNIQLAGRSLEKIKTASTGVGAIPKGFQKISYLAFDAKTPLIFIYQQQNEKDDTASFERVLEDMISTLKYF